MLALSKSEEYSMKLPVCKIDIQSDLLCPSCQERLEKGEITPFDIEFSKWLLERLQDYPELEKLELRRAVELTGRILLIVKKKNKPVLEALEDLLEEIREKHGDVLIIETPVKLRTLVRMLIHPAVEVGVNSLYLPDGVRESIVMLRGEDRERISYSKEELREIVSAVMGEIVLFEFDDERVEKVQEDIDEEFDRKLQSYGKKRRR